MRVVDTIQIWKGFFTYLNGYDTIDTYNTVPFEMTIIFNGNSFSGTATDSESETIFTEPIIVYGFIENEIISFVKKYPYNYYKDKNGTVISDKISQHPAIEYLGFYDHSENKYVGTWEMIIAEEQISEDEYVEEVANGEFELYRAH